MLGQKCSKLGGLAKLEQRRVTCAPRCRNNAATAAVPRNGGKEIAAAWYAIPVAHEHLRQPSSHLVIGGSLMVGLGLTVGLAVGGWFASSVIGKFVNAASCYANDQLSWSKDMKSKLKKLDESQTQIKTLVDAAEHGTVELSPGLQSWLWQLRDAVEAADSVLDEIEHRRIHDEVTNGEKVSSSKKVLSFARRVLKADPVKQSLQEVLTMFDGVLTGLGIFAQALAVLHVASYAGESKVVANNLRETSSLESELKFFGRVNEVEDILKWILMDDSSVVSAMSVVGIGGLGKTALAQHVFNENALVGKFNKIWVHAASRFEPISIANKMLKSVMDVNCDFDLDGAHRRLKEKLMGKRFLLVLDDVWNDADRETWNTIIAPLRFAGGGSKILLTTRLGSVADMIGKVVGRHTRINLEGLKKEEYLLLFNQHAFAGVTDPDDYGRLPSIGLEISEKLNGIPLAAKTIGAMLNSRLDDEYWTQILETRILDIEKDDIDLMTKGYSSLMSTLRLSYQDLHINLQRCFRYCSIFPQGHEFTKEDLVQLWIAAGLIPQPRNDNQTLEDVACGYFDDLVRKSFFDLKVSFYVIHDLLHELAQSVAVGECFRVDCDDHAQIMGTTRHLYMETIDILALKKIPQLKYLRTLILHFNGDEPELSDVINNMLRGAANLRVLELSIKSLQVVPESIE
ncbi:hypothetical protein GUJ93_ZPchr0008g11989 [Zizania palustris]|uniref:NB-ARC domain-containing protein n=1 Tax=Zizania palustris TaxID=103762 RepID=A0A8J5RZ82_ZIZPA|nr:hypothetical protein GUJ93_ZPchr0008g11989 [Zizania palustris]